MDLTPIVNRNRAPRPWSEGENIPWNDPVFSRRMLREHLSQEHDAASRRFEIIDRQVGWIAATLLGGRPGRVLDLGCGPGFYSSRLARRGHRCLGIDFSPASIAHARAEAAALGLSGVTYVEEDIRRADYGAGHDLAMLLYGEFNVFSPGDARLTVEKMRGALRPGGTLLLEAHTRSYIRGLDRNPARWTASSEGLFSDGPHLLLIESTWDEQAGAMTTRYYVIEQGSENVTAHAQSFRAWANREYEELLAGTGFEEVRFLASMDTEPQEGLIIITARRPG